MGRNNCSGFRPHHSESTFLATVSILETNTDKMSKFSVLFLAGGYGTRLASDVEKSDLLEWKYLKASPKALVRLDGQPLLSRWINQLEEIISEVEIFPFQKITL